MVVNRVEIKQWAKEKVKGHIWEILLAVMITSIVTNLTLGQKINMDSNGAITVTGVSIPLGMLFYFVEVGLIVELVFNGVQHFTYLSLFSLYLLYHMEPDLSSPLLVKILLGTPVFWAATRARAKRWQFRCGVPSLTL